MAQAHYVKRALKDNPVAKKGESYYWWKHMIGGRGGALHYSKTPPKPSQLTTSEFLQTWYQVQEALDDADPTMLAADGVREIRDEQMGYLDELADTTDDKVNNLPEGLADGAPGERLRARAEAAREWSEALGQVDLDDLDEDVSDEDRQEWIENKLDELRQTAPDTPE